MTQSEIAELPEHLRIRVNAAIEASARRAGVEPISLLSRSRLAEVSYGRKLAAYSLRRLGLSYPKIGRLLNRDHSTAIYLDRQLVEDLKTSQSVRNDVLAIFAEI